MEKRMNHHNKPLFIIPLIILSVLLSLSACSVFNLETTQSVPTALPTVFEPGQVTAEGWVMPARYSALGFLTGGELSEILVREGQDVHQGDVLATLADRETLEASLSQATMEQLAAQQALEDLNNREDLMRTQSALALMTAQKALLDAQNALDHLNTPQYQDRLDDLNEAIQDANDELEDARENLNEYLDLDPDNTTRKNAQEEYDDAALAYLDAVYERDIWLNQLDQAQAAVDLAQAQMGEAQRSFDAHQNGPDPDDLALAQARLDNANVQITAVQAALANMELLAPYDATVFDINDIEPGESVAPGTMLVILADTTDWMVETRDLSELDVVEVEVGQRVSVTPDALPELALNGIVESIDRIFTERSGDITYTVHIRLDEVDPSLQWGMTVTVTFK
jgi:multidrug efflux pump subunit AcrA (membrane-fusion protein)